MRKLGFTAIELVFSVSFTFSLFITAVNGLGNAQITFRDNARRDAVNNLKLAIDAYFVENQSYPESLTITDAGTAILLSPTDRVPLTNPAAALNADSASTTQATVYCYKTKNNEYVIGADLEAEGKFERATEPGLQCDWQADLIR